MISVSLDMKQFEIDMKKIVEYSTGFLEGVSQGTPKFLEELGKSSLQQLKEFIDSNARTNPSLLHHVYEWYQVGSPDSRLFDIKFSSDASKITFDSTFTQSRTVQHGSNVPFFNKANIMENGIAVTVTPRGNNPLVFQDNGETVFTKSPVTIENPGGVAVEGSYKNVFDLFFTKYFSQSFLRSSGIIDYIANPKAFKNNLSAGKKGGKSVGINTGYKWISEAGVL
jgi:hypothetical protein